MQLSGNVCKQQRFSKLYLFCESYTQRTLRFVLLGKFSGGKLYNLLVCIYF